MQAAGSACFLQASARTGRDHYRGTIGGSLWRISFFPRPTFDSEPATTGADSTWLRLTRVETCKNACEASRNVSFRLPPLKTAFTQIRNLSWGYPTISSGMAFFFCTLLAVGGSARQLFGDGLQILKKRCKM